MTAYVVHRGKQYLGRLLARSDAEALKTARAFWGPGAYQLRKVS